MDRFIEDVALFWQRQGLPRIAGRIVALLLVCDPPYRSSAQLVEELGASKGSISSMTRLLVNVGTIETMALPGDRATYFRLCPDGMERKFARRVESMAGFRELAERGLELLADAPPERSQRLRETAQMYAFMERELPLLWARWRQERDA